MRLGQGTLRAASAAALLACALSGCASITRGFHDEVAFQSNPPGAEAKTSLGQGCTTPCSLKFSRRDEFSVTITKPGYHVAKVPVISQVRGGGAAGFAGNIIVGGPIGMGVDAVSGATFEHYPNPVTIDLVPVKKGEAQRTIDVVPGPPAVTPEELHPRFGAGA